MKLANRDVRPYVRNRKVFKANNLFAERTDDCYIVYSYRLSWPLFIYSFATQSWFENEDRYSVTTSRHRSQAHPHTNTTLLSREKMLALQDYGYVEVVRRRIINAPTDS
jgi:hypothetical protein